MDFYSSLVQLNVGSMERIKLRSAVLSCFHIGAETFDMSLQVSCPDRRMRLQSRVNMDLHYALTKI